MVGELAEGDDAAAARVERVPEAGRIAEPAERGHRLAAQASRAAARRPSWPSRHRGAWVTSSQRASGASRCARRRMASRSAGASMSARERATTSARRSPVGGSRSVPRGKTWPKPNGSRASSSTMSRSRAMRRCWKASSSTIDLRSRTRSMAARAAATRSGFCKCGTSGSFCSQFQGLVVRLAAFRPVAAADHRDANAVVAEPAGDPRDHGRLAGAAEREVAHADHRHAGAVDFGPAGVVAPISPADGGGVGRLGQPQPEPRQAGAAPSPAADQICRSSDRT